MTDKRHLTGITLLIVLAMLTACSSSDEDDAATQTTFTETGNPSDANPSPTQTQEYRMADIVNEDTQRYDIQIDSRNTWIDAGARMSGEASNGATIQIVGGPGIRVSGSGDVVIKNGAIGQR